MAIKCSHIPQTPRLPHMKAPLYTYSSVEIRPARNIIYSPSTSFFVNRWESAGSLDFSIPPRIPVPLPSRGPVYRCLERSGWGQRTILAMSWFSIYFCCADARSCAALETTWLARGIPAHKEATSGIEGLKKKGRASETSQATAVVTLGEWAQGSAWSLEDMCTPGKGTANWLPLSQ